MTVHDADMSGFRPVLLIGGLAALGALVALSFAGWMRYGPEIFLVLSDNGINWCL